MQFLTLFTLAAIATVSAAAQQVQSASEGSCSQGTPQCCSSVHDGADAQSIKSLIGLDDVAGQVGLSCVSSDLQRDLSLLVPFSRFGAHPLVFFFFIRIKFPSTLLVLLLPFLTAARTLLVSLEVPSLD